MLGLADYMDMRGMEHGVEGSIFTRIVQAAAFLVWAGSACKLFFKSYHLYSFPLPIKLYVVFFTWAILPIMLTNETKFTEILFYIISFSLPALALVSAHNSAVQTDGTKGDYVMFAVIFLLLILQYMSIFREINFLEMAHLISSYYLLYTLPLLLLIKPRLIKVAAIFVVIVVLFSSLKRSGILALAISLFFYIFISQYVRNKFKLSAFIGSLFAIVVLGTVFVVFATNDSGSENIMNRFENIDRDQGSGRLVVWEQTMSMIEGQEATTLLFGNGYNAVMHDSTLQLSAHNDFLEVTYDFGIVGLLLYLAAFITLGFYVVKMIVNRSPYAPPMAMLFIIYFIQSMISHIIIYYWANIFMLTFGYIIGKYRKDGIQP
jgi:O-antigen ligase